MHQLIDFSLGAIPIGDERYQFRVWAPTAQQLYLELDQPFSRMPSRILMERDSDGYFSAVVDQLPTNTLYYYAFTPTQRFADPASRSQPDGVHGPSQIADPDFMWLDSQWRGMPLTKYIIYQIHIGTFTRTGTFASALSELPRLRSLGITAIQLMPVQQFAGEYNWGYDTAFPFAVQHSYGGIEELKCFVNVCHLHGIAVILDVVYSHTGPEGNHLHQYGPYFSPQSRHPNGQAFNFDGPHNHHVRRFFLENVLYWLQDVHIDCLRIGGLDQVYDQSAQPFLSVLKAQVDALSQQAGRDYYLIAASDENDARLVLPQYKGGIGFDSHWNDDYHYALHALLTHQRSGNYADYGKLKDYVKALKSGYVFTGQYSSVRKRPHGVCTKQLEPQHFVVYTQNHHHIGHSNAGERLTSKLSIPQIKLAMGLTLLSPYIPMIFMGEEYAEVAPFHYFTNFSDREVVMAVNKVAGDRSWHPQAVSSFTNSKLDHTLKEKISHQQMWRFTQTIIHLRKNESVFIAPCAAPQISVDEKKNVLMVVRRRGNEGILMLAHFNSLATKCNLPLPEGEWEKLCSTEELASIAWPQERLPDWLGSNSGSILLPPYCFAVYKCRD